MTEQPKLLHKSNTDYTVQLSKLSYRASEQLTQSEMQLTHDRESRKATEIGIRQKRIDYRDGELLSTELRSRDSESLRGSWARGQRQSQLVKNDEKGSREGPEGKNRGRQLQRFREGKFWPSLTSSPWEILMIFTHRTVVIEDYIQLLPIFKCRHISNLVPTSRFEIHRPLSFSCITVIKSCK